jgi:hypothetical protein
MTIDNYINSKREANEIFHLVKAKIPNSKKVEKFKNTNEALLNFIYKIENLLEGVLSVHNNLYSVYVLYRSLIEHHLIQYYIFLKHTELNSDKTGEDYCKSFKLYEFIQEMLAERDIENIIYNKKDKDLIAFIRKKYPDLKEIDKSNLQEISKDTKEFNYKYLSKYIYLFAKTRIPIGDIYLELIKEYSKASSFTHGGPYSDKRIELWNKSKETQEETLRIIGLSISIYVNSIRSYIMFLIEEKKEALEFIEKINAIRI